MDIDEQNFLKDLLKFIGQADEDFQQQVADGMEMDVEEFDMYADTIWEKLQNGRLVTK